MTIADRHRVDPAPVPPPESQRCPIATIEDLLVGMLRSVGHGAQELSRFATGVAGRLRAEDGPAAGPQPASAPEDRA